MVTRAQPSRPELISQRCRAALGEGPVWDERQQRLYWVDIEGCRLHYCDADGAAETCIAIGKPIGCIALRRDAPGLIAGLGQSIARIELDPLAKSRSLRASENLPAAARCNDGKCDAAGCFWVGTYNMNGDDARQVAVPLRGRACTATNGRALHLHQRPGGLTGWVAAVLRRHLRPRDRALGAFA